MGPQWVQIWHVTCRNLSNPNVSRCAAHLLSALLNSGVFQAINLSKLMDAGLFSDGLNGPVGMSDAALSLWSTIIQYRSASGQLVAQQTVVRLMNWFSSHYTLSSSLCYCVLSPADRFQAPVIDRAAVKQMALHATPLAILKLLLLCTNTQMPLRCANCGVVSSPVFIAAFERHRNVGLCRYLIQGETPPKTQMNIPDESISKADDRRARETNNDHAVVEMLLMKLQSFKDAWIALSRERASNISADTLQIMVSLVVICSVMPSLLGIEHIQTCKELIHNAHQVWALLSSFIELSEDVDSIHTIVAATVVTTIRTCDVTLAKDSVLQSLSFMLSSILIQLHRNNHKLVEVEKDEIEMVDIGDSFASCGSQANFEQCLPSVDRQDLPFATSHVYLKRDVVLQLHMYASNAKTARLAEDNGVPRIIEYLVNLPPEDLLASRPSIPTFLQSSKLSRSEACRFLKTVAQGCIQDYDFERCEASLCFCLEVMTELAELWATNNDDELHGVASDIYEWFIEVPLGKGLASNRVLMSLATLLQTVLSLNPTYNSAILPSSRTSLFEILRSGSNVVKFHVAKKISHLFDQFILTEHTAILDDVVESLPNNSADLDGIALRLYVLAELAANWSTLLRPSMYHLFETTAHIPLSVPHAQTCLQKISASLELDSPRDLFLLFAPQLLYTWLETETIESMPFSIYGFQTLRELVAEVQHEVVGQIVMRANNCLADRVSEIMATPFDVMLEGSLAKAEAYSLARDISMPPSKDSTSKNTESQVRKRLGNDKFLGLVSSSFPQIVATLFASLSDEHEMERALARRPEFAFAAANLQSICRLSASKIAMPPGQQPSFRAKYLLDELEFLCLRTGKNQTTIWTSPLVVYISRSLLDLVVPALGSLHTCSTLRKVRVLVALADQEALQGYALEMLLQALQPFLTNAYSAEDALGLFWYLLDHGRGYLQRKLSFLCEIALTTLLSLSAFLTAPQDSTTQESHHLSTLSVTSSFHKWLGEFLATFPTHDHAAEDAKAFKILTSHAQHVRPPGRADKDSVEGKLLLILLEARTSERKILSPTAFKMAIQTLCGSFILPAKPEDDILWHDSLAIRHARVLWSLLDDVKVAQEFWIWSGEALGRAYAASGVIDQNLTIEHSDNLFQPPELEGTSGRTSRLVIMESLRDLLHSNDQIAVSLAEKTLQLVITQAARQRALDDYQGCIDLALTQALNWHPSPCPEMTGVKRYSLRKDEPEKGNCPGSAATWASQFMVSLTSSVKDDALLGALPAILSRLPGLAVHTMPFIVHCFLQVERKDSHVHRQTVSQAFSDVLLDSTASLADQRRLVLSTLLYLRCQPLRKETTIMDRSAWLDVDFGVAAAAASSCAMYKSALILIELHASEQMGQSSRSSRRSSVAKVKTAPDLMHQIYQSLDDPDFVYGMQEKASVSSVMRKLGHEGDTVKYLSFQSAVFDANIKASDIDDRSELFGALVSANMNGVAHVVRAHLTSEIAQRSDYGSNASLTALNLHQWDLPIPDTPSDPSTLLFQVIRTANSSPDYSEVQKRLKGALFGLAKRVVHESNTGYALRGLMTTLATLAEAKEVLSSRSPDELAACWLKLTKREKWQETAK
jgi:serine-protein kinase ATM